MSEVAVCILPLLLHRAAQSGIEPVASQLPVRKQNGCFNALREAVRVIVFRFG